MDLLGELDLSTTAAPTITNNSHEQSHIDILANSNMTANLVNNNVSPPPSLFGLNSPTIQNNSNYLVDGLFSDIIMEKPGKFCLTNIQFYES